MLNYLNMTNDLKIDKIDSINLLSKLQNNDIRIPYFQREYTWDKECVINFINDILNSQTDNYFLGTIMLKRDEYDNLKILDGQQRITTLILIFFQLKRLIKSHKENIIDEDLESINKRFKKIDFKSSNLKDGDILKKIIDNDWNDSIKDENIKNSLYWENSQSIDNRLSEIKSQKNWTWEKIYDQFKKTVFALVILTEKYNENDIFEKINSTGKPLTQFDLVKNFLFSKMFDEANVLKKEPNKYIQPKLEQIDNFINKIEDKSLDESRQKLIRHFVAYKTGILETDKNNNIYKKFKQMLDDEYKEDPKSASKMFDSLINFSIYYKYIKNKCWKANKKFSKPFLTLYNQLDTFIVLIIRIFEENSKICDDKKQPFSFDDNQENEILNSLLLIENYIYRRKFARLSNTITTRKIPTIIFNNYQYKQDDNEKLSTSEKIYFELFLLPNKDKEYRAPDERELIEGMKEIDAYKTDRKTTKTFLFRLGTNFAKEQFDIEDFNIEHVLPQDHSKWKIEESNDEIEHYKHTIGNLTLTSYNSEYSNKSFDDKKQQMSRDNFPLNKYFISQKNWDIKQIHNRGKHLYEEVQKIWKLEWYENNEVLKELKKNIEIEKYKENPKKEEIKILLDNKIHFKDYEFDLDKNYKRCIQSRSRFKKIQSYFTRELINDMLKCYCVDGWTYEQIENRYFEQYKFYGWVFKSIREALEINKDDKGNISESYIDLYIANKSKLIDKFLYWLKLI